MQTTWQKIKTDKSKIDYLKKRAAIIDQIRAFFKADGFLEIDSPLLVKSPGMEPYLEVFETKLLDNNRVSKPAYLLTSPEYAMKKLLAAGMSKIFTICKSFRNGEGLSPKHNSEFTIMEWYRANANYEDIMRDCENLFVQLAWNLFNSNILRYQGKNYDLTAPWERISVSEAFAKYCEIDTETLLDEKRLLEAGKKRGFTVASDTTWEQIYNQFFLNDIDPHLGEHRPTIIYDYPASQASLAKRSDKDPRFAERFEFYIAGIELGNAFSELTDAKEQLKRFELERAQRVALGKTMYDIDMDYIAALESGIPPTGGIAVGIDRICMLFADTNQIDDVLIFPVHELWADNNILHP